MSRAESSLRPNAVNYNTDGSVDYGCFQINSVHRARVGGNLSALFNAETDTQVAVAICQRAELVPVGGRSEARILQLNRNPLHGSA